MRNHSLILALPAAALIFGGCAAVGAGLQVASMATGNKGLADAGKSVSRAGETEDFTPEQKYYTGRTVAADLLLSEKPSDDAKLEAYVGKVGQTLALGSGMGELPQGWHFILLEDPQDGGPMGLDESAPRVVDGDAALHEPVVAGKV